MQMATNLNYDTAVEGDVFDRTFQYLDDALGSNAFKRWNGHDFTGKFLMSVFEVLATGVSHNIDALRDMVALDRNEFICNSAKALWGNEEFTANSGAGIRGTTRLAKLLPIAANLLNPKQA
jgi:hypothetical protein